jgi:hypothetical protein
MCVSCIHPYYAHTTPNAHPHHNTPTCTAKFINITPAATPKLQGVPYEPDAAILYPKASAWMFNMARMLGVKGRCTSCTRHQGSGFRQDDDVAFAGHALEFNRGSRC